MPDPVRFENYELLRREDDSIFELGRGAMGVTYKAFDTDLHCDVALKVINPGIIGNGEVRERFLREARAAAQLRHPNIATAFRLGRAADDTHFYAMEFCDGPTLAQAVAERGALPFYESVYIAWQVSKALVLAGEHRLLHRDLKPSNLILTTRPDEGLVVKVIDFGLAKSFADGQQSLATTGGGFAGTAQFASPEQLEEKELDIRSDIYSLGHCLWFMLTGRAPFEGSLARVMSQTLTAEPPWEALAKVPESVVAILRKMLAKNPADRQPDATALRRELQKCLHALAGKDDAPEIARAEKPPAKAEAVLDEAAFHARFSVQHPAVRDVSGQGYRANDYADGGSVSVLAFDAAMLRVPALRREIEARVDVAAAHPHPGLRTPIASTRGAHGLLVAIPWVEGFTLLDLLKERGSLAPSEVLRLAEPLARAADHAAARQIAGLDFAKGQIVAHFPGGLSGDARGRVLALPVDEWPAFEIKAGTLSLGELDADSGGSLASMDTLAPATGPAAALAPVRSLAALACEMLGASGTGAFAPIARLSESANAVLRRGLTEDRAFPNAAAFVEALRAAVGSGGTSAPPRLRKTESPLTSGPNPPARKKSRAAAVLVFLAVAGILAGYWFGIHLPRERERKNRASSPVSPNAEPASGLAQTSNPASPAPTIAVPSKPSASAVSPAVAVTPAPPLDPPSAASLNPRDPTASERDAIFDAMRAHLIKPADRTKLTQEVVFVVTPSMRGGKLIQIVGEHACFQGYPAYRDGSEAPIEVFGDVVFETFLKRDGATWRVIADLSRTDVPDEEEMVQLRRGFPKEIPKSLVSDFWRQRGLGAVKSSDLTHSPSRPEGAQALAQPYQRPANLNAAGNGSGFFITQDGYFVTNQHVVQNADALEVKIGGRSFEARVVKADAKNDIAVLKIEGTFSPLPLGEDLQTRPGDEVFTIGFPMTDVMGEAPKTTTGTVSALSGADDDARTFQISVQIQPGNSGGPLVLKSSGNVIGVTSASLNAAKLLKDGRALPQNVNYAMKASYIRPLLATIPGLLEKLPAAKSGTRPWREVQEEVEKCTGLVVSLKDTSKSKPAQAEEKPGLPPAQPGSMHERVGQFCEKLLADETSRDLERILADYAPVVDYGEYGSVDHSVIRKDKAKYFERWPRTSNRIKGNVTIRSVGNNSWVANFTVEWTAADAKEKRMGESDMTCGIGFDGRTFKVVLEKIKVTKQVTPDGRPAGTAATYRISSLGAKVTRVRFFSSAKDLSPVERRKFHDTFSKSATRYISFQIELQFPRRQSAASFTVTAVWQGPAGFQVTQDSKWKISAGWSDAWHANAWGYDEPGRWVPGNYTVDFLVGKEKIATGKFQVVDN